MLSSPAHGRLNELWLLLSMPARRSGLAARRTAQLAGDDQLNSGCNSNQTHSQRMSGCPSTLQSEPSRPPNARDRCDLNAEFGSGVLDRQIEVER